MKFFVRKCVIRTIISTHTQGLHVCRSLSYSSQQGNNNRKQSKYSGPLIFGAAAAATLGFFYVSEKHRRLAYASWLKRDDNNNDICKKPLAKWGAWREGLPVYCMKEVEEHSDSDHGIWTTYKEGVYDISSYIGEHPGGASVVLLSAGHHLEPLFRAHPYHETDFILERLEQMRIGNLDKTDQVLMADFPDPYGKEPARHKNCEAVCEKPYCGGVKLSLLADNFHTPNEYFYVRNHLPVPQVDPKTYELLLEVEGTDKVIKFKLEDIKRLPRVCYNCTLMCTGNRRVEMMEFSGQKSSVPWGAVAMGNALWAGVRLSDLLKLVCIYEDDTEYKHVQFEGCDLELNEQPYGSSIPLQLAVDPKADVIIAYEMNGVPLTADHGFPLRVIIPGHSGARNCKWLSKIKVSMDESLDHRQQCEDKLFGPSVTWETADYKSAPTIQDLPVTSAICTPCNGATVEAGDITVKGYAYSGLGQKIVRVDVSADQGMTWHTANIDHQDKAEPPRHWSWSLWSIQLPVDGTEGEVELWCKAVDSACNTQAESYQNIYNFKLVNANAYHRVKLKVNGSKSKKQCGKK